MNSLQMRKLVMQRMLLLLSGVTAIVIAGAILFVPEMFYANYGIELAGDAALRNELKAPAGLLLVGGTLILGGVVRAEWTAAALITSAMIYLSYGLSRITSIVIDGMPNGSLVEAAVFEIAIGVVCLLALAPDTRSRFTGAANQE